MMMDRDIYPTGTVMLVMDCRFDEFEVVGYSTFCQICGDTYENVLYYKLKNLRTGSVRQVVRDLAYPKHESPEVFIGNNLSKDELLDMYRNYKELYAAFGDNYFLETLAEVESKLHNKNYLGRK